MPFISVVPALRTPFGVDVFDYKVEDGSSLKPGDLIRVPFRKQSVPALIVSIGSESPFADKATAVSDAPPLIRLGPNTVALLEATARHSFASRPSVLLSWIRNVPQRAVGAQFIAPGSVQSEGVINNAPTTILTASRIATVLSEARRAKGRVLVLTPWKQRADSLAQHLNGNALHADLADGAAWTAWTQFVQKSDNVLVATRIGAWLAAIADVVIMDEPENDDYKQDELAPRFDARYLLDLAAQKKSGPTCIHIGTTPLLQNGSDGAPSIDIPLRLEPWQRGSFSSIDGLSASIFQRVEEAFEKKQAVIILHPIRGDRAHVVCRDCSWSMKCAFCDFPLAREDMRARCRRCGRAADIPPVCPSCGGADLNKSRPGKDHLAEQVARQFVEQDIRVVDLFDWHRLSMKPNSLVVLTDLSLIGGYAEDIRRRERLVIAWRRLTASVSSANGELLVQGPEELLSQARAWLTAEGLATVWKDELKERQSFRYPPARRRIKMLVDGTPDLAQELAARLSAELSSDWTVEGPFPVAFRSHTRSPRHVLHLLPPPGLPEIDLYTSLEPFAKKAIIDLDPIAFFS